MTVEVAGLLGAATEQLPLRPGGWYRQFADSAVRVLGLSRVVDLCRRHLNAGEWHPPLG
jgi:hypothetical protein